MEITREQVMRYLRGQLDATTAAKVSQWLDEHPDAPGEWLNETGWNQLVAETQEAPQYNTGRVSILYRRIAAVAAVLLLFFIGKQWLSNGRTSTTPATIAATTIKTLANDTRQKVSIILPDGSVTELQPGASLQYDSLRYNATERNLLLNGVARFTVAKDSTRPFRVRSAKWTTTALGTVFQVSCTKPDSIFIKLEEGRILVEATLQQAHATAYYLLPGDVFTETASSNAHVKKAITPGHKAVMPKAKPAVSAPRESWTFDHTPVQELITLLENAYGATIILDVVNKHTDFTGALHKEDPLNLQLTLLCNLNGWQWEKTDSTIYIRQ